MERLVELVIGVQKTTMTLLQTEQQRNSTPATPSLKTPLSTRPLVPPLHSDLAKKLSDF